MIVTFCDGLCNTNFSVTESRCLSWFWNVLLSGQDYIWGVGAVGAICRGNYFSCQTVFGTC